MKIWLLFITLLVSQLVSATTQIDNLTWELKKQTQDIKVMSAKVPESPYHAYLAVTEIDAGINELVAIIRTPATCADWVYRCAESYRYGQEAPNVDLVYTSSNMPFPVRDRDTLARIRWEQDAETNTVRTIGIATQDILPRKDNLVRIEEATVIWELTPLPNGNTRVRTYGHADPGGDLPSWLINQMSTDVPVKTLNNLKKLAAKGQYPHLKTDRLTVTGL
ncbi:MAG: START domain-containing protein [Pseudomonadota bacterium]|nr:START domain-containing protein [Pseudomonadota bacterium]